MTGLKAAEGHCWLVLRSPAGREQHYAVGMQMDLPGGSLVLGTHALFKVDGASGVCESVALESIAAWTDGRHDLAATPRDGEVPGPRGDLLDDLRDRLGALPAEARVEARAPPGLPGTGVAADGPADVRVLSIDYDDQGERHKDWRSVVGESSECNTYQDWPLEGEAVSLQMCKHFLRHGGSPLLWMDRWAQSKGMQEHERTYHELRCLLRAVYHFGTYDQVNMGASAGIQVLIRRVAQIMEAYRG